MSPSDPPAPDPAAGPPHKPDPQMTGLQRTGPQITGPDAPDAATPAGTGHADRFTRAREAQAQALLEDYVEMIGDLIEQLGEARVADIAARMGVAQPTATKAIARLKREGLATARPYRGVFLTETGARMADRVRVRHRTVVEVLVAVGVPRDLAELDAEGIEHHVSTQTLAAFQSYLDQRG